MPKINRDTVWTEEEIARRLPVWEAFTEFFRDSQLQDFEYRYMVERLQQSGFTVAELETILRQEVMPVFIVNCWAGAGNWTGWDTGYIRDSITAYAAKRKNLAPSWLTRWFWNWQFKNFLEEKWKKIAAQLAK